MNRTAKQREFIQKSNYLLKKTGVNAAIIMYGDDKEREIMGAKDAVTALQEMILWHDSSVSVRRELLELIKIMKYYGIEYQDGDAIREVIRFVIKKSRIARFKKWLQHVFSLH